MPESSIKNRIVLRRGREDTSVPQCNRLIQHGCERSSQCLSEEFLRYLDISGSIIVVLDRDGRVQFVNQSACEALGTEREEMIGQSWFDQFVPVSEREVCRETFRRIVSGELSGVEHFENRILDVNGEEMLVAWHNSVLREPNGNIRATLSSGEDITEKRRMETQLQETFARLSMAELIAGLGHWSLDLMTNEMDCSDQVCRLLGRGYDHGSQRLEDFFECVHPTDRDRVVEQFMRFCVSANEFSTDFKANLPDGSVRYLQLNAETSFVQNGPRKVFGTLFDITERKKSEIELRESERRYKDLVERAGIGIAIDDLDGNLIYFNNTFAEIFGYTSEEMKTLDFEKLSSPDANHKRRQLILDTVNTGPRFDSYDFVGLKKDGTKIYLEVDVVALKEDGRLLGWRSYVRDVTASKIAHEELEKRVSARTAELREANERLKFERESLERKNIALQEVLQQLETAKRDLGRNVQRNVESVVQPLLVRLESSENSRTRELVRITRESLTTVIQPFTSALESRCRNLSPRETEVCNMIRQGMSSKEIASIFGTSEGTVKQQRKTIRRKLGISGKSQNLNSVLKDITGASLGRHM